MPTPASPETSSPSRPPILMVGAARSGTTLLREMLNAHPQLNCYGELVYATLGIENDRFPDGDTYRDLVSRDRIYQIHNFPLDEKWDHRQQVRSFIDSARALAPDQPYVGVTIHHHLHLLPDLWPDAAYIHVLRDPRDVARSTLRLGWNGHPYFGTGIWLDAHEDWKKFVERVPADRHITVRYDDLVRDTEGQLRRCCEHIGVAYDDALMDYSKNSSYRPPDESLIDQWKRKLSPRTVRQLESRLGPALSEAGFEPSGLPPLSVSPLEKAWLAVVNRWGRLRFQQERYGLWLWFQRCLAHRVGPRAWRQRVIERCHAVQNAQLQ